MNRKYRIAWPAQRAAAGLRRLRGEEGQNLIEYALVCLIFFTMLFGILGLGQLLYSYHFVSSAARAATRWAAVNGATCASDSSCTTTTALPATASDIQTFVTSVTPLGIVSSQITTTPSWPVQASSPAICSTAVGELFAGIPPNVVGYPNSPYPNYPGCTVEVQVQYSFNFFFPLIGTNPITLSSTSEMVIAQ